MWRIKAMESEEEIVIQTSDRFQVWSLTQLFSVGFSPSRIIVKKCAFTNTQSKCAKVVVDSVLNA